MKYTINLSTQSQKTLEQLRIKADNTLEGRMPSINRISKMLTELGIEHRLSETTHIVETRSGNNTYVNDRHEGKNGNKITILGVDSNGRTIYNRYGIFSMDSTDTYYSWNTYRYANDIINIITERNLI